MTVAMWVRFDQLTGGQYFYADSIRRAISRKVPSRYLEGDCSGTKRRIPRFTYTFENGRFPGSTVLQTNQWYHVAVVRDAATAVVSMYLNGQLDGSASFAVGSLQKSQAFGITPASRIRVSMGIWMM